MVGGRTRPAQFPMRGAMAMRAAGLKVSVLAPQLNPDRFRFGILVVSLERLVATAESRFLEAAEGYPHVALRKAIHGHRSGPQIPGDEVGRMQIVGVQRGCKSVVRIIGNPYGFLDVVERKHG